MIGRRRRAVAIGLAAALWSLSMAVGLTACSGDDDASGADQTTAVDDDLETGDDDVPGGSRGHGTEAPATGGLDIDAPEGSIAIPVPSLGFGVAIPDGWQATLLTDAALARVAEANLADDIFLDAARATQGTGAVFYAAGVAEDGSVSELKVDLQDDADTSLDAIRVLAQSLIDGGVFDEAQIVAVAGEPQAGEDGDGAAAPGEVGLRLDFRLRQPAADDGRAIDTWGSQLFVPAGERLWSLVVTAEAQPERDRLVSLFATSFTVAA